jgi:type IV pilus assembly protein PilA
VNDPHRGVELPAALGGPEILNDPWRGTDRNGGQVVHVSTVKRWGASRPSGTGEGCDAGFTLIEVTVVLVIVAILLAIAVPTFLSMTGSADERAAQSNLNTSLTAAKSAFQGDGQYYTKAATLVVSMNSAEPSLSYQSGDAGPLNKISAQNTTSVATAADGNAVVLAALATNTGDCWYVVDNVSDESGSASQPWASGSIPTGVGTYYGEWKDVPGASPSVSCDATDAPSGPNYLFRSGGFPDL